ncbi:hypothetical protein L1987_39978 [Smallanthus sonchifolius]|uniref:Uncharacterized protein n=1 Tax=Smallanthus sonchifolius TaxID=185202 RepID=A0ACB9GS96_9ASTR|nr:hypothetical protein L1987_39978 [Smallanthus sonchifolius]
MEKLPESLYADYTGGASTSNTPRRNTAGAQCLTDRIHDYIKMLNDPWPSTRGAAIVQLVNMYKITNKIFVFEIKSSV